MEKEKKIIKWNQCGLWPDDPVYDDITRMFLNSLTDEFEFVISDEPDYLFVSCKEDFKFLKYDCIRIFHSDENIHPDFHLFDYVVGYPNNLIFGDRYCHCLPCLENIEYLQKEVSSYSFTNLKKQTVDDLKNRKYFCDFVYHHDSGTKRSKYFGLLNSYKTVSSLGDVFKSVNKDNVTKVTYLEKLAFEQKCKFSICIESCDDSKGLVTEKIFHSLLAGSIPIYLGDESVTNVVNPKRFINIRDFKSDEELLKRIIEIDNNDDLFLKIVNEQPLLDMNYFVNSRKRLDSFMRNIFNQPSGGGYRRPKTERYWNERLHSSLFVLQPDFVSHLKKKKGNVFVRGIRKLIRIIKKR